MDNNIDLAALANFLAVVKEGSFSGAARARKVPVSTVSKHVQDLEAKLGVRLLQRTTRAVRLTAEGALLAERGGRLTQDVEELERLFSDRAQVPKGLLRVACPQLFGTMFLGPLAADLLGRFPDLQIEIVFRDSPVDLIEDGFDCAIKVGALEPSALMARTFARARNGLYSSPGWLATQGPFTKPDELPLTQTIAFANLGPTQIWTLKHTSGEHSVLSIQPRLRLGAMLGVRDATIAGAGVAMLPSFLAETALQQGTLVAILPDWQGPTVDLSIVWPTSRHLSPRLRAFIDAVAARFAGTTAL